jgi:hypothetical protein
VACEEILMLIWKLNWPCKQSFIVIRVVMNLAVDHETVVRDEVLEEGMGRTERLGPSQHYSST